MTSWKKYERLVAELCSEDYQSPSVTVMPNAKIKGCLSQTTRQVDVLIDSRFGDDRSRRIIVDVKKYNHPLIVKDVESFHGMMIDCSTKVGILVCPYFCPHVSLAANFFYSLCTKNFRLRSKA
ncbi:restriction endonuclease [Vibrio breoganii]